MEYMTEQRCPDCEALLTELECFECAWHAMHEIAMSLTADKLAALAPPTRTHCIRGHEMTEENTRTDAPVTRRARCKTCHAEKRVERKARQRAEAIGGQA